MSLRLNRDGGNRSTRLHRALGPLHDNRPFPERVIVTGCPPAGQLLARVVNLAEIDAVADDRTQRAGPRGIAAHLFGGTVRVINLQPRNQAGLPDRQRLADVETAPHPEGKRIVPAVPQFHRDDVLPVPQQAGHIIRLVQNPDRIRGPDRGERRPTQRDVIHPRVAITEPNPIEPGLGNRLVDGEGLPKTGRLPVLIERGLVRHRRPAIANPAALRPVTGRLHHRRRLLDRPAARQNRHSDHPTNQRLFSCNVSHGTPPHRQTGFKPDYRLLNV